MTYDTALFWDVENLTGGYAINKDQTLRNRVARISLKAILAELRQKADLGCCGINRAYADWSNGGLAGFRNQLNELGIEAVQAYGFSYDNTRNAADLQIVTDAVDLMHRFHSLTNFVFVTGDGGYSAVAKRLREYGKRVVGGGYKSRRSTTFAALCDPYVTIPNPAESPLPPSPEPRSDLTVRAATLQSIKRALADLKAKPAINAALRCEGVSLSRFDDFVKSDYPALDFVSAGFQTLVRAVERALPGTGLDLRCDSGGEMRLFLDEDDSEGAPPKFPTGNCHGQANRKANGAGNRHRDGMKALGTLIHNGGPIFTPYIPRVHNPITSDIPVCRQPKPQINIPPPRPTSAIDDPVEASYREALRKEHPDLNLPEAKQIREAAALLASKHLKQKTVEHLVNFLSIEHGIAIPKSSLEKAIHAFKLVGVFECECTRSAHAECLTLRAECSTEESIIRVLREKVDGWLGSSIGEVREEVLRRIVP